MSYTDVMPRVVTGAERRFDPRVRIEVFLNEIIKERPYRALATNLSDTGLLIQKLAEPYTRHSRTVGVEIELPDTHEVVWARAETRFDWIDEDFHYTGLRFTAMARKHARLIRDYVYDKHRRDHESTWLRHQLDRLSRPAP